MTKGTDEQTAQIVAGRARHEPFRPERTGRRARGHLFPDIVGHDPDDARSFVMAGERGRQKAFGRGFDHDQSAAAAREDTSRYEATRTERGRVGCRRERSRGDVEFGFEGGDRAFRIDGRPADGDRRFAGRRHRRPDQTSSRSGHGSPTRSNPERW